MNNEKKSLKVTVGYDSGDQALESALSIFKKMVNDAGVYEDYMRTKEYEKPSSRNRRRIKSKKKSQTKAAKERAENIAKLLPRSVIK
jgi:ribosomal protein S21